jgi:hypothetical protein
VSVVAVATDPAWTGSGSVFAVEEAAVEIGWAQIDSYLSWPLSMASLAEEASEGPA